MSVQFASKGVEWTDAMKECVHHRIADPLRKHIPFDQFDIRVHLSALDKLWMRIELKLPNEEPIEMVLREGDDFYHLTNDVSINMRAQLKKCAEFSAAKTQSMAALS